MWTKALDAMLTHLFREGDFKLTFPDGMTKTYGDGGTPSVAVTLKSADLPRRLIMSPDLAVGEAYMNGDLVIENDDLYGFLSLAIQNKARQG
ncbi:MAG: SAM-dependent methyltransferase, partial [Rhodobacteraceae bacterium]|nr:SAM-dependent methyltransferase [Paracoccaceae bacterium]